MTLLHHGHQEHRFIVILGLGQIYLILSWLVAISGPMSDGPTVMTLVITLRSLHGAVLHGAVLRRSQLIAGIF
jgi:hypothetical protein